MPVILSSLLLISCQKENCGSGSVRVSFSLDDFVLSRSSSGAGESEIRTVQIFVTDSEGDIVENVFRNGISDLSFKGRVGETYHFYAFANNPSEIEGLETEDDILEWEYCTTLSEHFPHGFPMAGDTEWTVSGRDAGVKIVLTRLVSRLQLTLDNSLMSRHGSFSLSSVKLRNCPSSIKPFVSGQKALSSGSVGDGDEASADDLAKLNAGGSVDFYILENMQGDLLPGNGDPWAKIPSNLSSEEGLCTYLEAAGSYSSPGYGGNDTYRMYLGGDSAANFDLCRNSVYRLTLIPSEDNMRKEGNWKITASDWKDSRKMSFSRSVVNIQPGRSETFNLNCSPADFEFVLSDSGFSDIGLSYSVSGNAVTVSCSGDATTGKEAVLTAKSWDGRVQTSVKVHVGSGLTTRPIIILTPAKATLSVGETLQMNAVYRIQFLNDDVWYLDMDKDVTSHEDVEWKVNTGRGAYISVTSTGLVTALSKGTTDVYCIYGGDVNSADITVE